MKNGNEKCIFCTDPAASGEVVYEDGSALVVVHPDRAVPGHLMIVSRSHVENPSQLSADEWDRFTRVWHRAERVVLELTGCERAIAMKLGIATPHLHVHLYPVRAAATREEVFAAIDGTTSSPPDVALVSSLREMLR